jgi:hypothetical protein
MIIEYALLAIRNIPELISSAVNLLEDYKLIAILVGSAFIFLVFFVIGRKW